MDSIYSHHRKAFGKNFFKNNWLPLEIVGVFLVLCFALAAILQVTPQYFYKAYLTETLLSYSIDARAKQQEQYAWYGAFYEDISETRGNKEQFAASTTLGVTTVTQLTNFNLPQTSYALQLKDTNNSVLRPQCNHQETTNAYLLPYICKQKVHYGK